MTRAVGFALLAATQLCAQRTTPDYTQSSIVHAATGLPGALAPNTIATIYGVNLAAATRAAQTSDIRGAMMSTSLPGTGTIVLVGGVAVPLYYASPSQVNFLVPSGLASPLVKLTVVVDGISGHTMDLPIVPVMPGLFLATPTTPAATDLSGRPITTANPAGPGQWISLYATGLGATIPNATTGELARTATPLESPLQVRLGNVLRTPVYAGLAPGYAGVYQINLLVPDDLPANPELRLEVGGMVSPPGVFLPTRKPD